MYARDIGTEFATLRPHLPEACNSVLDVGCGLAGIDAALHRYLGKVRMHLVDRDLTEQSIGYGYQRRAAFYNSVAATFELLRSNGVAPAEVEMHDADKPLDVGPVDLAISLLAWGFHFPIETFLDTVARSLGPAGRVIVDVRKGTDGIDVLQSRFRVVKRIVDDAKRSRVVAYN